MIAAGFHTRGDEWVLPLKMDVMSRFCDAVVVCLDRPTDETLRILARYPKARPFEHRNTAGLPDYDPVRGPLCEEGLMRQEVFDACAALGPEFIMLGDTDEVPTPDVVAFLDRARSEADLAPVDVFRMDIVNLYRGADRHVSGRGCVWSYEHPTSNKRGAVVRYRRGLDYRYDVSKPCHVPLEPSVAGRGAARATRVHLVKQPKVLHYKFADWGRWLATYKAGMRKYQDYWAGLETSPTPPAWLWSDTPVLRGGAP